jgi:hypothetical protein
LSVQLLVLKVGLGLTVIVLCHVYHAHYTCVLDTVHCSVFDIQDVFNIQNTAPIKYLQ